jgi:hypothetical protein
LPDRIIGTHSQRISYYACRKRLETKECDQEYVRAEWLEQQILADIQLVFRDEALLEEVWQSAQKQLAASAPELDAHLDLPVTHSDFLNEILTNLSGVVGAIPAPQRKHLLQLLVEEVLVHDRCAFEVWYRLPQFQGVRTLGEMVAPKGLCTNRRRRVRQRLSARAVFLIDARYGCARESLTGGRVRVVGRGVGAVPGLVFRAPRSCPADLAMAVG